MALTSKQAKFVSAYQLTHDSTKSAINAGYSEKSAPAIGCQLLANPKIKAELDAWKTKKTAEITKEDFVDLAIGDYKALNIDEPNKPRFLDIAGKALGYLGVNGQEQRPNQSLTINNISLSNNSDNPNELWDTARRLLEG